MNKDGVTNRYTLGSMYLCTYERMKFYKYLIAELENTLQIHKVLLL